MTKIEKSEFHPTSNIERAEDNFHFEEIAEIESATVSLVRQLKEKIENGEYDELISDDVGGRIPTLVLRRIIKEVRPDKSLDTYFIASGKAYFPSSSTRESGSEKGMYDMLQEHLSKITKDKKKALLVTQYVHTGKTLIALADALKEAGLKDFDIAALDVMPHFEYENALRNRLDNNRLYVGSEAWHHIHEEHEKLAGVRKSKKYVPYPRRATDVIKEEGRELSLEEWKEIFDIKRNEPYATMKEKMNDTEKNAEYERRVHAPLTTEEAEEIQKNINLAREDIKLLVQKVIRQVWE
ncbi:MAG: hypothetical protein HYW79_02145 [Parcubacteria group bacterium]|nr:hypothetical protein [Parcubacteria group bacterium]